MFGLDLRLHVGNIDSVARWTMPPFDEGLVITPPLTLFSHMGYLDEDVYPEGVVEVVGYWAENRILGGVVLFARRE